MTTEPKGWSHPGEFDALAANARDAGGPFMEIGTYAGRSAVVLGAVAKELDTVLFCVDHHRGAGGPNGTGSPEMRAGRECHDPDMVRDDGRFDTLPDLRRNLADADLEAHVIPIVASSQMVSPWWHVELGFLFIDAGHDLESVGHDYQQFSPYVRPGGMLAFHDADAAAPARVADQAEADGWQLVEQVRSLRVLTR